MPIVTVPTRPSGPPPPPPKRVWARLAAALASALRWLTTGRLRQIIGDAYDEPVRAAQEAVDAVDWPAVQAEVADALAGVLAPVYEAAERAVLRESRIANRDVPFQPTDALEWARHYSGHRVVEITEQVRQAIRERIVVGLEEGRGVDEVAAEVRQVVGLHSRWATAVARYGRKLAADPTLSAAQRRQAVARYRDRLLDARARNIAHTELLTASNAGRFAGYAAHAVSGGLTLDDVEKVWLTAKDERICKVCLPLNGVAVPFLEGTFETARGAVLHPPAHPSCRCTFIVRARTDVAKHLPGLHDQRRHGREQLDLFGGLAGDGARPGPTKPPRARSRGRGGFDPSSRFRIVQVEDTREFFEDENDKWRAIPGSGTARPCDRCGRTHEIHAHVETDAGENFTVGIGCAKTGSMERDAPLKAGASAATTVRRLEYQLAAEQGRAEKYARARAEVAAMAVPATVIGSKARSTGEPIEVWSTADGRVTEWVHRDRYAEAPDDDLFDRRRKAEHLAEHLEERRASLASSWRQAVMREDLGITYAHEWAAEKVADLDKRLAKARKRLAAALAEPVAKHGDKGAPGYHLLHPQLRATPMPAGRMRMLAPMPDVREYDHEIAAAARAAQTDPIGALRQAWAGWKRPTSDLQGSTWITPDGELIPVVSHVGSAGALNLTVYDVVHAGAAKVNIGRTGIAVEVLPGSKPFTGRQMTTIAEWAEDLGTLHLFDAGEHRTPDHPPRSPRTIVRSAPRAVWVRNQLRAVNRARELGVRVEVLKDRWWQLRKHGSKGDPGYRLLHPDSLPFARMDVRTLTARSGGEPRANVPAEDLPEDERATLARIFGEGIPFGTAGHRTRLQKIRARRTVEGAYPQDVLTVEGTVEDPDGRRIGHWARTITRERSRTVVRHGHVLLDREAQGTGFARGWLEHLEDQYRAEGFAEIQLEATLEAGGYAWAALGFDWLPGGEGVVGTVPLRMQEALAADASSVRPDPALQAELADALARIGRRPPEITPFEVSRIGYRDGKKWWPGKRILTGSEWLGVKRLTPVHKAAQGPVRRSGRVWVMDDLGDLYDATVRWVDPVVKHGTPGDPGYLAKHPGRGRFELQGPSPLDYRESTWRQPLRAAIVDADAGPPGDREPMYGDHYAMVSRGPSGRRLTKPRRVDTPPAAPGTVVFADYTVDGNELVVHYMRTRQDARGEGLATRLLVELIDAHPDARLVNWGKVMADDMERVRVKVEEARPDRSYRHKRYW